MSGTGCLSIFHKDWKSNDQASPGRNRSSVNPKTRIGSDTSITMNWQEFFSMGGYGLYVWLSYGLMALILILNILLPLRNKSTTMQRIRNFLEREDSRSRRRESV